MNLNPTEDVKLIYVGDPMCSWCYGVSNEMLEVQKHYEGKIPFELVLGGLRPYNKQTMVEMKDFLTHHWEDVANRSGQKFNYAILDNNVITYDTEPSCRATVVVRSLKPELTLDFFKAAQRAFYFDNKNLQEVASYEPILNELEIDVAEFTKLFNSDAMKQAVREDFQLASDMGVRGFPTLLLQQGDKIEVIVSGYASASSMIQGIEKKMKK